MTMLIIIYIFTGLLLYPSAIDMWYRIQYSKREFIDPDTYGWKWYLGFILFVLTWVFSYEMIACKYLRETLGGKK